MVSLSKSELIKQNKRKLETVSQSEVAEMVQELKEMVAGSYKLRSNQMVLKMLNRLEKAIKRKNVSKQALKEVYVLSKVYLASWRRHF